MQAGERDDRDRLTRATHSFSRTSEHAQEAGRLLTVSDGGLVGSVLAEIDETVLRRSLHFRTESGSEIVVDVCDRRVLSILSGDFPGADIIVARKLSDEDAEAVLRAFSDFCVHANQMHVVSHLPDKDGGAEFGGISVQKLFALARSKQVPVPADVAHAIERSKAFVTAVVAIDDDRVVQWGDDRDCVRLSEWMGIEDLLKEDEPCVSLWEFDTPEPTCVLYVKMQACAIGLTCSKQHIRRCFDLWRQVVHSPP